jgi:hypothetical protein
MGQWDGSHVISSHDLAIGLCAACQHCRLVETTRSTFYLCERSFSDERYRKYPLLPVLQCPGYERRPCGGLDTPN